MRGVAAEPLRGAHFPCSPGPCVTITAEAAAFPFPFEPSQRPESVAADHRPLYWAQGGKGATVTTLKGEPAESRRGVLAVMAGGRARGATDTLTHYWHRLVPPQGGAALLEMARADTHRTYIHRYQRSVVHTERTSHQAQLPPGFRIVACGERQRERDMFLLLTRPVPHCDVRIIAGLGGWGYIQTDRQTGRGHGESDGGTLIHMAVSHHQNSNPHPQRGPYRTSTKVRPSFESTCPWFLFFSPTPPTTCVDSSHSPSSAVAVSLFSSLFSSNKRSLAARHTAQLTIVPIQPCHRRVTFQRLIVHAEVDQVR